MGDAEIEKTLKDISLDEIREITERATKEEKAKIEAQLKEIDPSLLASTNTPSQNSKNKNSKINSLEEEFDHWTHVAKSLNQDKYTSIEYALDENNNNIKVDFTSANKSNSQNQGILSASKLKYTKDPNEGIEINRGEKSRVYGTWISTSIKLSGFKAKDKKVIVINATYKIQFENGSYKEEKATIAYDVETDSNGDIVLERLGILDLKDNMGFEFAKNVNIDLEFSELDGSVSEHFNKIPEGDNNPNNNKNMASFYLATHANTGNFDVNKNQKTNNAGGAVGSKKTKNNPKKICKLNIDTLYNK